MIDIRITKIWIAKVWIINVRITKIWIINNQKFEYKVWIIDILIIKVTNNQISNNQHSWIIINSNHQ